MNSFFRKSWLSAIFCCFVLSVTLGQSSESVVKTDTLGKSIQFIGIPLVFYTPETKFGFGGGGQFFFPFIRNRYNDRVSNMLATVMYTTEKQLIFEAFPQIYFGKGDYYLDAKVRYRIYPNSFWGIGNALPEENEERYNMRTISVDAAFLKRLPPYLNFGFAFLFEDYKMKSIAEGGILEQEDIPGSDGAVVSGLAVMFNLDSRNNISSATKGALMQLRAGFSSQAMGATSGFNEYLIDLRRYLPISGKTTLAFKALMEFRFGDIPFQRLSWYGGGENARGYFKGRYIDNHQVALQAEYRQRFTQRWSFAVFGTAGRVAENVNHFFDSFKALHYSFGGGIRFKISKEQDTLIRLDYGKGEGDNGGIYFGVNEAF